MKNIVKMRFCAECNYSTKDKSNMKRHVRLMHKGKTHLKENLDNERDFKQNRMGLSFDLYGKKYLGGLADIRLKENFRLFVSGPSRCGKTVFIAKLIENIQRFARQPPTLIIYVYKVWQGKYDEMESLGVNFMRDNENIIENISLRLRDSLFWLFLMI